MKIVVGIKKKIKTFLIENENPAYIQQYT